MVMGLMGRRFERGVRMAMVAVLGLLWSGLAVAAEVVLDLPDPMVPGIAVAATLVVKDPPGQVAKIEFPKTPGLEWQLAGQTGTRTSVVNGVASTEQSFTITLRADEVGTIAVPPVKVRLRDGTVLVSAPTTLRVEQGSGRLTGEASTELRFEPATIVPGEPAKLIYRINLRAGCDVKSLGIGPPEGAITLGERSIVQGRTVDTKGQEWATVTVTWPITHATPGQYPVSGQQEYLVQVNDGFFVQWSRRQMAVPKATLTVEALPAQGRPADFTGLIGPLTVAASLDRERVSAGEGAVVSLAVTGRQTDLVKRPQLVVAGVTVYPKDDTTKDGTRTFRWDLVPATPGTVTIPPVHIDYFDPGSRSYRTADTQALTLTVIPGRSRDLGIVGAAAPATPAKAEAPAAPTLPAPIHGAVGRRPADVLAPAVFAGGLALSLLAGVIVRLPRRSGPHRGRALARAGQDPAALAAALAALRPALTTPAQRAAADALEQAIDRARFGGEQLPDLTPWISNLAEVP